MARANIGRGLTLASSGGHWYIGSYRLVPEAASRAVRIQAENYALAERNEDAARLYEAVGMWKEAGETRRKAQRQVVTQVHVNMNDLLDQLGRMGLTATYTCPACRSPLTISPQTSTEALTKCRYCGALIHPADIIEAIDRVVGDR
jgi:DNA-directed RNA polymerase subunit RPC12/RpoP